LNIDRWVEDLNDAQPNRDEAENERYADAPPEAGWQTETYWNH